MLLSHYSIGLVALYQQPQPGVVTASTRLPQIFTALHPIGEPLAAVHILALLFKFLVLLNLMFFVLREVEKDY